MNKKLFFVFLTIIVSGIFFITKTASAAPSVTITSPNGGETFKRGETVNITWNQTDVNKVTISLMSGSLEDVIVSGYQTASTTNTGTYSWTISKSIIPGAKKIQIIAYGAGQAVDVSDGYINIAAISSPTNISISKNTTADPAYRLNFNYTLPTDSVYKCIKVYRSLISGQLGDLALNCVSQNYNPGAVTGYYPYDDAYIKSSGKSSGTVYYTVRAVDIGNRESTNTDQYGYSWNDTSLIVTKSLKLTLPLLVSGAQTQWVAGETYPISWTSTDINKITIKFSKDVATGVGYNWENTLENNPGTYNFTVPPGITEGNYTLQISDAGDACDTASLFQNGICYISRSIAVIKSTESAITMIFPNGGETLQIGKQYTIKWTSKYTQATYLDLMKNGVFYKQLVIGYPYLAGDNTLLWSIPTTISPGDDYKIRITNSQQTIIDTSDNNFSIVGNSTTPPAISKSVTVLSPNGGETLQIGKQYTIKWNHASDIIGKTAQLSIDLLGPDSYWVGSSALPGKDMLLYGPINITTNSISGGEFLWTVPSTITPGAYKIEVDEYDPTTGSNHIDLSDTPFSITTGGISSIKIVSPNGGEKWEAGKTYNITWQSSGYEKVRVHVGCENYASDMILNIASGQTGGSYPFTVPSTWPAQNKCKVQVAENLSMITNLQDGTNSDYSDGYSAVVAKTPTATSTPTTNSTTASTQCLPDNTLIKFSNDPKVYVIINCQKNWIQTAEEFNQKGYKWSDVKETSSSDTNSANNTSSAPLQTSANLLRAIGQEKIYRVVNGKLIWIPTAAVFNAQGLKWQDVKVVNTSDITKYPQTKLVQAINDKKVYFITDAGLKKHIPNEQVFNSYNHKWSDITPVSETEINSFPDVNLIKQTGEQKVYKLENGQKRWIKTAEAFSRLTLDWSKVAAVNATELTAYPEATPIE